MKVAVVGCGAVGSFYGAKLAHAGHEVHFLLRSDYEVVRRQGVFIRSPQGDFRVWPYCAKEPEEVGPGDMVLIGLKTTANGQFGRLLPPLAGPGTAVLTLQNGLGNEEQLAQFFPSAQILGGLCFVCLNRLEPGLIHHIAHGQVVLGEFQGPPQKRAQDAARMFQDAGVQCTLSDNLARTHWEKLTWNIPFNGLGVAGGAGLEAVLSGEWNSTVPAVRPKTVSTDRLLADPRWTALVRELMFEIIRAAGALGFDIPNSMPDKHIERTRAMGAYKASTLLDFERGQPMELESLFFEPLRQARKAGVAVPRLESLCRLLAKLDSAPRAICG